MSLCKALQSAFALDETGALAAEARLRARLEATRLAAERGLVTELAVTGLATERLVAKRAAFTARFEAIATEAGLAAERLALRTVTKRTVTKRTVAALAVAKRISTALTAIGKRSVRTGAVATKGRTITAELAFAATEATTVTLRAVAERLALATEATAVARAIAAETTRAVFTRCKACFAVRAEALFTRRKLAALAAMTLLTRSAEAAGLAPAAFTLAAKAGAAVIATAVAGHRLVATRAAAVGVHLRRRLQTLDHRFRDALGGEAFDAAHHREDRKSVV